MVSGVSQEQKNVAEMLKQISQKYGRKVESSDWKDWDPTLNSTNVFDPRTWNVLGDTVGPR